MCRAKKHRSLPPNLSLGAYPSLKLAPLRRWTSRTPLLPNPHSRGQMCHYTNSSNGGRPTRLGCRGLSWRVVDPVESWWCDGALQLAIELGGHTDAVRVGGSSPPVQLGTQTGAVKLGWYRLSPRLFWLGAHVPSVGTACERPLLQAVRHMSHAVTIVGR